MSTQPKEGIKELEEIIQGFDQTLEKLKSEPSKKSEIYIYEIFKNHYQMVHEANIADRPVLAAGIFNPPELYMAMDLAVYYPEFHFFFAFPDLQQCYPYYDIAEGYGYSSQTCSPHRIAFGMAKEKCVPRPSLILYSSTTCDQTLKCWEMLSRWYQCPTFMLELPLGYEDKSIEFSKSETREMIRFLEEQTGKRLDHDRLGEVLRLSRKAHDYWAQIVELRKQVPCPDNAFNNLYDFAMILLGAGTPEAIKYFEARLEEIHEKMDKKEGALPQERFRVVWLYTLPYFDLTIADWMVENFGAFLVVDSFCYVSQDVKLDPSDPIDFLARSPYKWGFIRRTWSTLNSSGMPAEMAQWCEDYSADAVICFAHWSCRQYCATIKMVKDRIVEKAGLPFLILDGDSNDPRVASSARLKEKMSEFFGMIERKRGDRK